MQVLCKASNTANDVRCQVCGQGFLVYWSRTPGAEQMRRRGEVMGVLRAHHATDQTAAAHPAEGFHLPGWSGDSTYTAVSVVQVSAPEAA